MKKDLFDVDTTLGRLLVEERRKNEIWEVKMKREVGNRERKWEELAG